MVSNKNSFPLPIVLTFIFSLCFSGFVVGQNDSGGVEIIQDARIQSVLNKYVEVNTKKNGKIAGYRVQIHFGSDRAKAKEIKSKFLLKHNDVPAYDPYEQPNFKVRVGDFRTKLEAYKFMKEIMDEFPGCFIVQDDIELPRLD